MKLKRKNRWNTALKQSIIDAFSNTKFKLEFGRGFLNIARPDGIHCEFYPSDESKKETYFVATYTINGVETELDLYIPVELDELVFNTLKILR